MRIIFVALSAIICFASCEKGFDEINTDPNRISEIKPGTLLNPTIYEMAAFNMAKSDDITFELMQVSITFPSATGGIHRYEITENTGSSIWSTSYRWLNNIREIKKSADELSDPNYQAVAMTLNAWIYANLTDCFGPIPMDEATNAEAGLLQPRYNSQQQVYARILNDLDSANRLYNTAKPMSYGTDVLFANNIANWKRFTNSLRMRLLLRISKTTELNPLEQLRTMLANPATYPVFQANDQSAILKLTGITPLISPWGRPQDFTTGRAAAKYFLDSLNSWNDPRRAKFTSQARNSAGSANIGYKGIPAGYTGNENQFDYIPSNFQQALITAPMTIPILPYSEVEFIKSELYLKDNKLDSAKATYERGVKAAIEQWSLTVPSTYFTNASAAFNGTLERIMLQKYYALFFTDFQQWFEYRRTGYPVLPKGDGMLNGKQMPVRLIYPVSQRVYNPDNYNKAVSEMGGDHINVKSWWEK